ncbi:MAG: FGGY family carbohydrate kinase [Acidimicrobiales bacterium]|nr:FGGY family carbohydrate kinase [Acidimicrobiales bacterium]
MSLPVVAVDFGATSIRVCVVDLERRPLEPVVVHRYRHEPTRRPDGTLRWDWSTLVAEAKRGLALALADGPVASIGIDTWGLDYGLLDASGALVGDPHSYRDPRVDTWETTADRLGRRRIYDITGIQLMPGNSLFQLAAHDPDELARARHFLMLPELLLHELCGVILAERTSAGTTALVDRGTGTWSDELIEAIGAPRSWFADIATAGLQAGTWEGVPVHLVGGHDTACAVLAMAAEPSPRAAFVSGGTLFLIGRELPEPRIDDLTFERNLANEPSTYEGVRLLANRPGTWILEQCRAAWGADSVAALLADLDPRGADAAFDVTDPSLVAPDDMPAAVARLAGLPADAPRPVLCEAIVTSMARSVAGVVEDLAAVAPIDEVVFFGGASGSAVLRDRIAAATGRPVRTGATEATALGNALAQGIALGRFTDVAHARAALAPSPQPRTASAKASISRRRSGPDGV